MALPRLWPLRSNVGLRRQPSSCPRPTTWGPAKTDTNMSMSVITRRWSRPNRRPGHWTTWPRTSCNSITDRRSSSTAKSTVTTTNNYCKRYVKTTANRGRPNKLYNAAFMALLLILKIEHYIAITIWAFQIFTEQWSQVWVDSSAAANVQKKLLLVSGIPKLECSRRLKKQWKPSQKRNFVLQVLRSDWSARQKHRQINRFWLVLLTPQFPWLWIIFGSTRRKIPKAASCIAIAFWLVLLGEFSRIFSRIQ